MNYTTEILPAIVTILDGTNSLSNGQAKIYNRPQYSHSIENHLDLFVNDDGVFHVWWPKRIRWSSQGAIGSQILREITIQLYGYRAIKENSGIDFEDVIDNVTEAFDDYQNFTLDGSVAQHSPINLLENVEESFGGVLCHKAVLEFTAYV